MKYLNDFGTHYVFTEQQMNEVIKAVGFIDADDFEQSGNQYILPTNWLTLNQHQELAVFLSDRN